MEIYVSIMEIFELRYFLAVAKTENVNKAAENINVSAGSLSKAIARLENELQTPLFYKVGRGIKLTIEGQTLKTKALQILQLEEDTRLGFKGHEVGSFNIYLSSEEILQTSFGVSIAKKIETLFGKAKTHFIIRSERQAIDQLLVGEVHLALITHEPPINVSSKILSRVEFQICAAKDHPLVKKYGSKAIPIEEVLKQPFALPDSAILGKIDKSLSIDGWRDDKFPRQIKYKVCGLKLIEQLISNKMAIGYLPDYFIQQTDLIPLKISGYSYTCNQTVRLIAKDPAALGWLDQLWDKI